MKIDLSLGDKIGGKKIFIDQTLYNTVNVYQQHNNGLSITDEGPHCDLTQAELHTSEWTGLSFNEKSASYLTKQISQEESENYPELDFDKIKKSVNEFCGERWSKILTKNMNNVKITTSSVVIKLLFDKDSENPEEKFIIINTQMGC